MGMVIRHNLNAIGANNNLNSNVQGGKKAMEKLASGYQINRAGDNAAGLAISEKMRAQIGGLTQAAKNTQDGISLIQTAEGGLNETHSILQRMRELSVQSANGTYQDFDRQAMNLEVDALKSEIDRISEATEYNGIKLLNGDLSGVKVGATDAGPRFGAYLTKKGEAGAVGGEDLITVNSSLEGSVITSDIDGITVSLKNASTEKGENAEWDTAGKTLTLNLVEGNTYSQSQIDDLIKNAKHADGTAQSASTPDVTFKLKNGVFAFDGDESFKTRAGEQAVSNKASLASYLTNSGNTGTAKPGDAQTAGKTSTDGYATHVQLTARNYGNDARKITIATDAEAGKENVERTAKNNETQGIKDGEYTLHLSTGKEYSEADIEKLLAKSGLEYEVNLTDNTPAENDKKFYANTLVEPDNGVSLFVGGPDVNNDPAVEAAKKALEDTVADTATLDAAKAAKTAALASSKTALDTATKTAAEWKKEVEALQKLADTVDTKATNAAAQKWVDAQLADATAKVEKAIGDTFDTAEAALNTNTGAKTVKDLEDLLGSSVTIATKLGTTYATGGDSTTAAAALKLDDVRGTANKQSLITDAITKALDDKGITSLSSSDVANLVGNSNSDLAKALSDVGADIDDVVANLKDALIAGSKTTVKAEVTTDLSGIMDGAGKAIAATKTAFEGGTDIAANLTSTGTTASSSFTTDYATALKAKDQLGTGSATGVTTTGNGASAIVGSTKTYVTGSPDALSALATADTAEAAAQGTYGAAEAAYDVSAPGIILADEQKAYDKAVGAANKAYEKAIADAQAANAATGAKTGAGVGADKGTGKGEGLTFQIGANGVEDQRVTLNVDDMSSTALGVQGISVATRDDANSAISKIDDAINAVSLQRAGLGAMQNRLEHTYNNLTTTNENLTNAESSIRDTDMATEMINYTKFNILQQAAQSMLAQANQQPQSVLQLLG